MEKDKPPDGPYKHLRGMLFCFWNMPDLDGDVQQLGMYDPLIEEGDAHDEYYDEISELVWHLCGM